MADENKTKPCVNCGHNPNEDRGGFTHVNGPYVTKDVEGWNREWVHARSPRFYLYKIEKGEEEGRWIVVDRDSDLPHGKSYAHKKRCVSAFVRGYFGRDERMELDTNVNWKWGDDLAKDLPTE